MTIDANAPPAASRAEAKAYLRLDGGDEDAVVDALIGAATGLAEGFTGQALVAREVSEALIAGRDFRRLARCPVRAIVAVEDAGGLALPIEAYAIDIDRAGDGWVRVSGGEARVTVRYQAGIATAAAELPEPIRHGVVRLAAHLFANRDGGDAAPPAVVAALWRPWRRMRLR